MPRPNASGRGIRSPAVACPVFACAVFAFRLFACPT